MRHSLTPFSLALKAMRLMNADRCPATWTRPLGLFIPDKTLYSRSAYGLEVLNHAHPIFRPVTLVDVCQQFARKAWTVAAVTGFASNPALTFLDAASDAGLRLATIVAPATGTRIPSPRVCSAQSAVHTTGRDQRGLVEASDWCVGCNIIPLCRHGQNLADSRAFFNRCGTMVK